MMMKDIRPGMGFRYDADREVITDIVICVYSTPKADDFLTIKIMRIIKYYNGDVVFPRMIDHHSQKLNVVYPNWKHL